MLITLDPASAQPIHGQLAGQIRRAISGGDPPAGEKLPTAKELGRSLGINVHTVLRAYNTLRDEGLVDVRRGRGTVVTGTAPERAEFVASARRLVDEARTAGLSNDDIRAILEAQL